jgi:hypothetical protein
MTAKIYQRNNGEFGASWGSVQDTGHFVFQENSGKFTVCSVHGNERIICKNVLREKAEAAIEKDWIKS